MMVLKENVAAQAVAEYLVSLQLLDHIQAKMRREKGAYKALGMEGL